MVVQRLHMHQNTVRLSLLASHEVVPNNQLDLDLVHEQLFLRLEHLFEFGWEFHLHLLNLFHMNSVNFGVHWLGGNKGTKLSERIQVQSSCLCCLVGVQLIRSVKHVFVVLFKLSGFAKGQKSVEYYIS
jgi:hypothetical protein